MLTMDAREALKNEAVRLKLQALYKDDFVVEDLASGDYAALDTPLTLGIERKSFNNLAQSALSNELDEQLSRLAESYDIPVLLTRIPPPSGDGKVRVWGARGKGTAPGPPAFPFRLFAQTAVSWWCRGVLPVFVYNDNAMVYVISALYEEARRPDHREFYMPKKLLPNLRPLSLSERVMYGFPGIGAKLAQSFRGIPLVDLANAPVEWWQERLGPVRGKAIWAKWRES